MKVRTHWTISALKDFETCPAKYRYSYLLDADDWRELGYETAPYKGSPAMDRGTEIHQSCEDYLKGAGDLHSLVKPAWRHLIDGLKYMDALAEEQWEFEEGWHPKEDGPLWVRMKIDVHYLPSSDTLHVIDYKTGRPYPQNMEQVEVYALGGFARFDDVNTVVGELWYLDHPAKPETKSFHRSQVERVARRWEARADRLLSAVKFPPQRNRFCDWCPYNAAKGGPCHPPA